MIGYELIFQEDCHRSDWCYTDDKRYYPKSSLSYMSYSREICKVVHGLLKQSATKLLLVLAPDELDTPIVFRDLTNGFTYESTFFLFAVRFGSLDNILWFLERGANLDSVEKCSLNGEHYATRSVMDVAIGAVKSQKVIDLLNDWLYGGASIKSAK